MVALMIIQSLILLLFTILSRAQPLELNCSTSAKDESTYFPNIPVNNISLADAIGDSPYLSEVYIYSFQPLINDNCGGKTDIEVCFENAQLVQSNIIQMNILLGRIDNNINSSTTVIDGVVLGRLDIISTAKCNPELINNGVCCHTQRINISLPAEMNAFGVLLPDQFLLEYNNSQYQAQTFVANNFGLVGIDDIGRPHFEIAGYYESLSLRFLRFNVQADLPSQSSDSNSANIRMILSATLSPIFTLMIIITLTITIVVLSIKLCRKKGKVRISQLREEEAFDNANYGDLALVSRTEDIQKNSNVYMDHDYSTLNSRSGQIVRAISYEEPLGSMSNYNYDNDEDIYEAPASDECALCDQISKLKVVRSNRDAISLKTTLGAGQFGTVHKGEWMASEGGEKIEVAVKTLKEGAGGEDKVKFLQEAAIMGQFSHPNVVKLYGVITEGEPVMLILELLSRGDLRKVLNRIDPNTVDADLPHTLLSYCRQVASGMTYLASKLFVHRDLAARNILVSEDGACKIADFGMSRDLADADYYLAHGGKIPVRWTAPEALHYKKYSTASDVWSFGCVMYEIWSLGHKPFEKYTNADCIKLIDKRTRLAPPPGCPRMIYKLIIDCWHPESSSRPDFASMLQQLSLPDTKLLKWSEEDKATDPEAAMLGAGLDKAVDLYKHLQQQYTN